jgi:hypothetical protein
VKGVHPVGVDRIIERAAVAKATLYGRFRSRPTPRRRATCSATQRRWPSAPTISPTTTSIRLSPGCSGEPAMTSLQGKTAVVTGASSELNRCVRECRFPDMRPIENRHAVAFRTARPVGFSTRVPRHRRERTPGADGQWPRRRHPFRRGWRRRDAGVHPADHACIEEEAASARATLAWHDEQKPALIAWCSRSHHAVSPMARGRAPIGRRRAAGRRAEQPSYADARSQPPPGCRLSQPRLGITRGSA